MAPPPAGANDPLKMFILRATGGEIGAVSPLAPKVGPLPRVEDIQKATLVWRGLKVTFKLTIINRVATVEVVPSASSLILRGLNEPEV